MFGVEDQSPKFWGQKWKNRDGSTSERQRDICHHWKEAMRVLSMESKRTVHKSGRFQFPPRWDQTWKINALILSCARTAREKRWETFFERKVSQRPESVWPSKDYISGKCKNPLVWLMASSRVSELQNRIGLQIRWKMFLCAQRGWQSAKQKTEKEWW